jgi:integrase
MKNKPVQSAPKPNVKQLPNPTFDEVAGQFLATKMLKPKSMRLLELDRRNLKPFIGDIPIREITGAHLERWLVERGKKMSFSVYEKERHFMRYVFNYAVKHGLIPKSIVDDFVAPGKKPHKEVLIPTQEQLAAILHYMRTGDSRSWESANLYELLALSGMRVGEARAFTWGDIDWKRGVFVVTGGSKGTKSGRQRTVPLFPAFREFLERLRESRGQVKPTEQVVPVKEGKKVMASACKRLGLPRFNHHCMRHYFASQAVEKGINFKVVGEWLGHADGGILVARLYGHLRPGHSHEMAKLMTGQSLTPPATQPSPIKPSGAPGKCSEPWFPAV